jgi:hypothetical protein
MQQETKQGYEAGFFAGRFRRTEWLETAKMCYNQNNERIIQREEEVVTCCTVALKSARAIWKESESLTCTADGEMSKQRRNSMPT